MAQATTDNTHIKAVTVNLLDRVLPQQRPFAVRLWDGTILPATQNEAKATLVLRQPDSLGQMLQTPLDLAAGEAYLRGDFEVEGDLETVFNIAEGLTPRLGPLELAQLFKDALILRGHGAKASKGLGARLQGRKHSRARDRQAIAHHYDVSNRFYQLWLDERLVYSCGYFPKGDETLAQAQEAKLELLCRKLRLSPGEKLLDIGCGWGGLAIYAAQHHKVEAVGVTLSEQQLEEARARVKAAGLDTQVRIELLDYRDVPGTFDKIVSVGMAEHVGLENLPIYFQAAWDRLKAGGLMLNHAISRGPLPLKAASKLASGEFIRRYVFPDGEIVPLWQMLRSAEEVGFEVRDVEDLREHYAETLRCWLHKLERCWDVAVAEVGQERTRLWRLFMSGSAHQFACGHLSLHQALLAKPGDRGAVTLPASRADIYA